MHIHIFFYTLQALGEPSQMAIDFVIEREEEEEETRVIRFNINGKEYLKSEDNVLYDNKSHEAVGIWNEKSGSIDDIPNEEE